jgi:hypothetical protein
LFSQRKKQDYHSGVIIQDNGNHTLVHSLFPSQRVRYPPISAYWLSLLYQHIPRYHASLWQSLAYLQEATEYRRSLPIELQDWAKDLSYAYEVGGMGGMLACLDEIRDNVAVSTRT